LQHPMYTATIHGFMITLTYARILELFLIPPAIALIAGLVTTIGDVAHPWERIQLQFPPRYGGVPSGAYGQAI
jgi:hypothetical protein